MRATVLVPTFERRELVARVLEALQAQTAPEDGFEVIVVVDGSEDGTRELVEAFPARYPLRHLWQPNRGRAAACNAGLRTARGEIVAILDDDMVPSEEWLDAHVRAHADRQLVCVLGPVPVPPAARSSGAARYVAEKFERHMATIARPGHQFVIRDFYTGNASVRREVLHRVGGFDEAFTQYGNEDVELCVRLRRAGVETRYCAAAVAYQRYTKGFAELVGDAVAKGRTAVLLAQLHPEIVPELALSTYHCRSLAWRAARRMLIETAARSSLPRLAAVAGTEMLERSGFRRTRLLYSFLLDAFFWTGVRAGLTERPGVRLPPGLGLPWP